MLRLPFRLSFLRRRRSGGATPVAVLDALEQRALLAATLTPEGVVLVTGTESADAFVVRVNATGTDLQVQGSGGISLFRLAAVQAVRVEGGGGDDTLTIDTAGGLVARADAAMPITFEGGAGSDGLVISGAPAGVSVSETITPGPATGEGKVSSVAGSRTQAIQFSGVESLVDTSKAASLTVNLNDGGNLVEIANGPTAGGVVTGTIRAFDVTLCEFPVVPATTQATMAATSAAVTSSSAAPTTSAAGQDAVAGNNGRRKGKAKGHLRKHRAHGKAARKAAAAARVATASAASESAALATAPAAAPQQALLIGVAHVPIQFANKTAITINTAGGDDWVAVNNAAPAAGLTSLTVNTGDGQDHLAEVALPAGVTWAKQAAENVSATRGFVGVTECPPAPGPTPTPTPDPTPGSTPGDDDDGEDDDQDKKDEKQNHAKKPKKEKKAKKDKKEHKKGSDERSDDREHEHDDDEGEGSDKKGKRRGKSKHH